MPHMNGAAFRLFVMTASTMAALPGQQPLTLAAAVRYALEHSPKLAAARTETARRDALAAAARALLRHTNLSASQIARAAMQVAADLCIYTNDQVTLITVPPEHECEADDR